MPRAGRQAGRRRYDHFCAVARALDAVGDRWTLLVVRELLAGPRRYTDLHADLPGVSTDVLAARLRDTERGGVTVRAPLAPPASGWAYELTARGRALLPVLEALGAWGSGELDERRPTDAVRAHWLALPLRAALAAAGAAGVVDVRTDAGEFHLRLGDADGPAYGEGPARPVADVRLVLSAATCTAVGRGELSLLEGVARGEVEVSDPARLAALLGAAPALNHTVE